MAISEGVSRRRGIWNKTYSDGSKLYFSTFTEYNSGQGGRGLDPSSVKTYVLYQRPRGLVTEWVTGGVLGVDGKITPLKNSEAFRLNDENKLEKLGTGGLYDYPENDYVLGELARKDLVAGGKESLRYQTINNAKFLLQKDSGVSSAEVDNAFDISHNITPAGQAPTPSIVGDPVRADESTPTPTSTPPIAATSEDLKILAKEGIPGIPPRDQYGNLRYPKDLTPTSDSIQFTMISYGTKTFKNDTFGLGERDFNKIKINGSVTMSIQPSISDLNYVRWNPSEMGPIATSAADSSLTFIEEGAAGLESIKDKIAGTLGAEGPAIAKAIIASAAGQASGAKGLLTRVTGAMFNNNLELLFQGPELRQFTFTFKLSPRYKGEADDVKKIIRFFKQGSAVQRTTSNLFLKSPNVFRIKYLNGNEDHKSLNRMKECALVSCGVDYTPTGSYMTFTDEDASMVSYTLSLTFNELEPIYEDEYQILDDGTNDKAGIGY